MNLASRIFLFAYTAAMVSVATGFYAQHKSEGLWPVTLSSWARALWAPKELCISLFASNALAACGKMQFVNRFERARLKAAPLSSTKSVRL